MKEIETSDWNLTIGNLKYEVASHNPHAMNVLGSHYEKGELVNQDYEEAYKYYKEAASLGSAEGQYNVARLHYEAKIPNPSISTSILYLKKAISKGSPKAEKLLLAIRSMAETSLQDSLEKAEKGSVKEQYSLAKIYEKGSNGIRKDLRKAVYWYEKVANNGNRFAQYALGLYYRDGIVVKQNYEETAKWFTLSSEKGYPKAQFSLAKLYYSGKGVPLDKKKCYDLLSLASKKGYKLAEKQLERLGQLE